MTSFYEYHNVTERHEVSTCCWKNGADGLARRRVATDLQFVIKTQYLRSAIKRDMPLLTNVRNKFHVFRRPPIRPAVGNKKLKEIYFSSRAI
jgi:hypothetical protein